MWEKLKPRSVTRWLRFRLTLSYVTFFTILLVGIGFLFRQTLTLILDRQTHESLDQDWALLSSYLRVGSDGLYWRFPREDRDPEEAFIIERLKRIYLIADSEGRVVEVSNAYKSLGFESPQEIRTILKEDAPVWLVRAVSEDISVLIRAEAFHVADDKPPYYLAIGRSLAPNRTLIDRFTWNYFTLMPAMVLGSCLLGWFLAGRALQPLHEVAQAAENISGRNLSLRLDSRGAGDELDMLIDSFNRMIARLERSFEQVRQFSTDVSHELRTPITVVRGQLEVALMTAQGEEEFRTAIVSALQDVERLSKIVKALLLLSHSESGQLILKKESLDLSSLLRELVDQFEIPAEEAGVRMVADISPGCQGEVDRVQFDRMVSNLLSNAIKYTPAGGEVRVRLRRDGDVYELTVEDTGCGIAPEHLPSIFDRFYRVPSQDPHFEKGLGLGLSFVAWIVKVHGGKIDVDSKPNQGTRFVVQLPSAATGPEGREEAIAHVENA